MNKDAGELQILKTEYQGFHMSGEQIGEMERQIERGKRDRKRTRRKSMVVRWGMAAVASVVLFIFLPNTSANVAQAMSHIPILGRLVEVVTVRDYNYEDERHYARITVPEIMVEMPEGQGELPDGVQENMEKTVDEINAQMRQISDGLIREFEEGLKYEEGYQDMLVDSQVVGSSKDYFSLKLICYQGAGSGAEWDYFYTVDLNAGKRLTLPDLFAEGADFITPVSDNIKEQMRAQMAQDSMKAYWLDNTEVPEWNFQAITEETSFYINDEGSLVICFNEGDVAPMYMGCVEFVIPMEAVEGIWNMGNGSIR